MQFPLTLSLSFFCENCIPNPAIYMAKKIMSKLWEVLVDEGLEVVQSCHNRVAKSRYVHGIKDEQFYSTTRSSLLQPPIITTPTPCGEIS